MASVSDLTGTWCNNRSRHATQARSLGLVAVGLVEGEHHHRTLDLLKRGAALRNRERRQTPPAGQEFADGRRRGAFERRETGMGLCDGEGEIARAQQRFVRAINQVPGAATLDATENRLYDRYGVRFEPRRFQQPIDDGVRIYMALKGQKAAPGGGGFLKRFPDVTWDEGYTEAPDETAHGAYLHLVAGMGLAYDKVHLNYLAQGKLKIKRKEKDYTNAVTWQITRQRPILPDKWTIKPGPGVEDK